MSCDHINKSLNSEHILNLINYTQLSNINYFLTCQMESINSMEGKLFYLVHQMAERKMITMKDKGILKGKTPKNVDLIIGSNDEIINAYESYLKDGTELTLTSALLHSLVNGSNILSIKRKMIINQEKAKIVVK